MTDDGMVSPDRSTPREELKVYDPEGYELMKHIYPEKTLPEPWHYNVNIYDIDGKPYKSYDENMKSTGILLCRDGTMNTRIQTIVDAAKKNGHDGIVISKGATSSI